MRAAGSGRDRRQGSPRTARRALRYVEEDLRRTLRRKCNISFHIRLKISQRPSGGRSSASSADYAHDTVGMARDPLESSSEGCSFDSSVPGWSPARVRITDRYTHMHLHIYIHIRLCVCMYVCMYVCMHTCTFVCIIIHLCKHELALKS